MDDNRLTDIFGKVDEKLIEEAELSNIRTNNKSHRVRRVITEVLALAAGLVLIIIAANTFGNVLHKPGSLPAKNESMSQTDGVHPIPNWDHLTDGGFTFDNNYASKRLAVVKGSRGTLSMQVPSNWTYEVIEEYELYSGTTYGITLSPLADPNKFITVWCQMSFGVCGTGLEQKELTFGSVKGYAGYYDGRKNWSYIVFNNLFPDDGQFHGKVVVMNDTEHSLAGSSYEAELFKIFETLKIE